MNDLLKKLNVLVNSRLNDHSGSPEKPSRLPKNVEGEIDLLRGRVNEAVEYEDEIKARIRKFEDEAARWDAQADDAVTRGDDANARYAIEQMRKAQARARSAEDDLREHERTTQELIQRVNMLDAVIADARRFQNEQSAASPSAEMPKATEQPASEAAKGNVQLPDLGGVLRDARDKIASLADTAAAQLEIREQGQAAQEHIDSDPQQVDAAVDDDLENRRQRLSKR